MASSLWAVQYFGVSCFEQIIFHFKVPLEGTNPDVIVDWFKMVFLKCFLISVCLKWLLDDFYLWLLCIVLLIAAGQIIGLFGWIKNQFVSTKIYDTEFIDTNTVSLTYPEEKQNLIYIFLESMENTYTSKENGGNASVDVIPDLVQLNKEHISFSHTDKIGGAHIVAGTGWTTGGIVAATSGLGLTIPWYSPSFNGLPKIKTLTDILDEQGYNQAFCIGSKAAFGGREAYFKAHGDVQIFDTDTAKNVLPDNYHVFWGYEDKKLFEFAKEEVTKLADKGKPFHFSLLTVDTHHPYGYLDTDVDNLYPYRLSNIIYQNQKRVVEFIDWCKEQPFYENTTIVLCGDHTSMAAEYISQAYDKNFDRTTFNTIIHSKQDASNTKHRIFTNFDLFPTVLAAMGIGIDGDRLGFGTNLFSSKETLPERIGLKKLDQELRKRTSFWKRII